MVSGISIAAICITLAVSLLLPIIVFIVYAVKHRRGKVLSAWLLGAAGFFVLQILIRLPIISVLGAAGALMTLMQTSIPLYFLMLAATAALAEVFARWINAWIMRKNLNYERAFASGLGHGGIEAIVLIGMTYINNLIYAVMINNGTFSFLLSQMQAAGGDVSSLVTIQQELIYTSPVLYLLAGYERVLTMICQLALTLVVCYYYAKKKTGRGLFICFTVHLAVDFVAPFISNLYAIYGVGSQALWYTVVYVFLTIVAVLSVLWIRQVKMNWKPEAAAENAAGTSGEMATELAAAAEAAVPELTEDEADVETEDHE